MHFSQILTDNDFGSMQNYFTTFFGPSKGQLETLLPPCVLSVISSIGFFLANLSASSFFSCSSSSALFHCTSSVAFCSASFLFLARSSSSLLDISSDSCFCASLIAYMLIFARLAGVSRRVIEIGLH